MAGGELGRDLQRRLRQQVEDLEAEVGAEDVAEALGDLCRPFVSEVGDRLQVVAEAVDHECQIHDDITMTSLPMSVKCHQDTQPASACRSHVRAGHVPSSNKGVRSVTWGGRRGREASPAAALTFSASAAHVRAGHVPSSNEGVEVQQTVHRRAEAATAPLGDSRRLPFQ